MYAGILSIPLLMTLFFVFGGGWSGGRHGGALAGVEGLARGVPCPFCWWGLFGDEAVGEEAVVLVVADDEVIEEVDIEDIAGLDEFGGYFFVCAAGFGIAGWVVVDDHDGVCVGEEGAFVDFAGVGTSEALRVPLLTSSMPMTSFLVLR